MVKETERAGEIIFQIWKAGSVIYQFERSILADSHSYLWYVGNNLIGYTTGVKRVL